MTGDLPLALARSDGQGVCAHDRVWIQFARLAGLATILRGGDRRDRPGRPAHGGWVEVAEADIDTLARRQCDPKEPLPAVADCHALQIGEREEAPAGRALAVIGVGMGVGHEASPYD